MPFSATIQLILSSEERSILSLKNIPERLVVQAKSYCGNRYPEASDFWPLDIRISLSDQRRLLICSLDRDPQIVDDCIACSFVCGELFKGELPSSRLLHASLCHQERTDILSDTLGLVLDARLLLRANGPSDDEILTPANLVLLDELEIFPLKCLRGYLLGPILQECTQRGRWHRR